MEARVKTIRRKILSSANLETFGNCNERKGEIDHIYLKKQEICDFLEEMEKESSSRSPTKKEARYSVSHLKRKYFY